MAARRRVLLAGWSSSDEVIATVGDELGAATVGRRLGELGVPFDVAEAPYLGSGVDWREADPSAYTHLVLVSGPIRGNSLLRGLTCAFEACRRWAVDVSVVDEAGRALFDRVWVRDAPGLARPDLAVDRPEAPALPVLPVLAVAFTPRQGEYGERSRSDAVRAVLEEWLASRDLPWFELTTDLYEKPHRHRPAAAEALVRRADVVLSMRLHGLVLGLAHGRPVIAVDPVAGGAKVTAQAGALGWPLVLPAEDLTPSALDAALDRCQSGALSSRVTDARQHGLAGNRRARVVDRRAVGLTAGARPGGAPGRCAPEPTLRGAGRSGRRPTPRLRAEQPGRGERGEQPLGPLVQQPGRRRVEPVSTVPQALLEQSQDLG